MAVRADMSEQTGGSGAYAPMPDISALPT